MSRKQVKSVEYITEQGVRKRNEDTFIVDDRNDLFGVFDGASSLVPYETPDNKSGALVAAETTRNTFVSELHINLADVAIAANNAIEKIHKQLDIDVSSPLNRFSCTAAVVQIHDTVADLVQIGDSVIIVEDRDGTVSVPLGYHNHDLEVMRKWRKLADRNITGLRDLLAEDVRTLRTNANTTYGTLNGDPRAAKMLSSTTLNLEAVASILIITDGLFIPRESPDDPSHWAEYINICRTSGIDGLLEFVRSKENDDPDLILYPRYKIHDDATGIFITLS